MPTHRLNLTTTKAGEVGISFNFEFLLKPKLKMCDLVQVCVADSTTSPSTSRPDTPSAWSVDTVPWNDEDGGDENMEPDSTTGPEGPDLTDGKNNFSL